MEVGTMEHQELKIVVGAGEYKNNPGWIHKQEQELNLLDEETWSNRFKENTITAILAEHVWEHLTYQEGVEAARICYRYLRSNGYVRCAVPDGFFSNAAYQNMVKVGGAGSKDHPAASHKIVYDYHKLSELFESVGFKVKLLEYFDENGIFQETEWKGEEGSIFRSKKYDPRNRETIAAPSLIIDDI
ncbi:SAM-dependent methyltransferase [Heyndrickxia camelliae]|uniref:SAM-dependent methyltransferase n=2 Tax=Heyndrickxia camelliae TaxID=1707093 RepID=A0A2N3LJ51_9BACI|nr:SAM-dependent methyltransferase [Heyndrickxia camelliae]